jgi:branched-chain amino acid transport system substrate-binding protein
VLGAPAIARTLSPAESRAIARSRGFGLTGDLPRRGFYDSIGVTKQRERNMPITRRAALAGLAAGTALAPMRSGRAAPSSKVIRIGHLTDISGPYASTAGLNSTACARQAVLDFDAAGHGIQVEVIPADHQNNPDIAMGIAREWFDRGDIDAVLELNNSAIALGMNTLTQQKNKVHLNTGAVSAALTGPACTHNMVHWTYDSWMMAHAPAISLTKAGDKDWYVVAPDYAFGAALTQDVTRFVTAEGGRVLGVSRHPFPGVTDFSSYLLAAQASGAKVVALANGGNDIVNCMKQAREFGLPQQGIRMVALACQMSDIHGMGLATAQGMLAGMAFYWDLNERTRAFAKRVVPKMNGTYPSSTHAGAYACTLHYLKAVAAVGVDKAKESGLDVVAAMKRIPTDDDCFGKGLIREDGRKIHPTYLLEAKTPGESKFEWDLQKLVSTIPAEQSFRPLNEGGCPFIKT